MTRPVQRSGDATGVAGTAPAAGGSAVASLLPVFLIVLVDVFGREVPEPVAAVVMSWATDPLAGGSYSYCPQGAEPWMLDLLGEPVSGRLLLAGEHTQSARGGYADGAYVSGLRAAEWLV